MFKLKISDIAGEHCVTSEDGQKVYEQIIPKLRSNEKVFLDFSGVSVFASPFFNFSVGQLMRDFTPEKLNELVEVEGLCADGLAVWRKVINNAREYYTNPDKKKAIDQATQKLAEEQ